MNQSDTTSLEQLISHVDGLMAEGTPHTVLAYAGEGGMIDLAAGGEVFLRTSIREEVEGVAVAFYLVIGEQSSRVADAGFGSNPMCAFSSGPTGKRVQSPQGEWVQMAPSTTAQQHFQYIREEALRRFTASPELQADPPQIVSLRVISDTAELEKVVMILTAVQVELKIIVDKGSLDDLFSNLIERQCIDRIGEVLAMFQEKAADEDQVTEKRSAARQAAHMLAGTLNSVNKTVEEWKGVAIGTAATSTTIASGVTVLTNVLK